MHNTNYALEVLVNGRPVQEFYKDSRSFIEARSGTEYTLRFRNNSHKRVLAIFSVDGVEVLKGKAAGQADNGYVVDAFSSIEVKGYRIDDKTVAAFRFSGGAQSYSVVVGAETKDPVTGQVTQEKTDRNNGVIGVRVFAEDVPNHDYNEAHRQPVYGAISGGGFPLFSTNFTGCAGILLSYSGASCGGYAQAGINLDNVSASVTVGNGASTAYTMSCARQDVNQFGKMDRIDSAGLLNPGEYVMSTQSLAPAFDLGTQWGGKVEDKIREVSFKRAMHAVDVVIYYASRQSLEQWGIDFSNTKQVFSWPAAFEDKKRYCKVPPGYDTSVPAKPSLKVWTQR